MSRDEDVGKMLGGWLGKARKFGQPPPSTETKQTLDRPETSRSHAGDGPAQLNFKVPHSKKKYIKQLAVRDNITLLVMLDRMLELYEREYGKLGK
jgi:hypothetical protein